ncbi:hypothetical protein [Methylicorpusculum sp.]|uniref:hypothetical protein n=1 Tax=Methylicorpusculum sp. TaxID=2713644 RepID=UPI0027269FB4|nr:hypothetical protein [Methylicorpusculum sp.]MDO8846574.1 hypothetical protein [Methylicorpusculum sp.]
MKIRSYFLLVLLPHVLATPCVFAAESDESTNYLEKHYEQTSRHLRTICLDGCDSQYTIMKTFCSDSSVNDPVACLDDEREDRRICRQGCDN